MWKKLVFVCVVFALMTSGCSAEQVPSESGDILPGDHVIVYYFHGDFRCANCHEIETYTKEAVDEYFGKEAAFGKLVYKMINVDRKENQHFVKDYQLYTKSVIVSLVKDGKEVKYENLQGVWNYLRDKDRFLDYIRTEVGKYLKELT